MLVETKGAKIYLCVPSYGEHVAGVSKALCTAMKGGGPDSFGWQSHVSSALTYNFNIGLAAGITARNKEGVTHFAMLHADITPEPDWLDILLGELRKHDAAVVSAVIPIKNDLALTTTAIGGAPGKPEVLKRLTVKQARRLPKTFTNADAGYPNNPLLINTGCWICDLRQPWVDKFAGFDIVNGLDRKEDGTVTARFFSEDWLFGVWLHAMGVKVMATTAVRLGHIGPAEFRNDHDWGLDEDPGDDPEAIRAAIARARGEAPVAAAPALPLAPAKKAISREIVAVRYAEGMAWVHGWLDYLLVKHGPDLTYRIYDKGPGGDTPNIGNLDWTYLYHIVTRWDELADWTVFTQADPFPHLDGHDFADLFRSQDGYRVPFIVNCREWGEDGRLRWHEFPEHWKRQYANGTIAPAKLSLREWFKEYIGVDIEQLGHLEYHPGAIFGVDRATIQRRPKAFYERLLASLGESGHPSPEVAHYAERSWSLIFGGGREQ